MRTILFILYAAVGFVGCNAPTKIYAVGPVSDKVKQFSGFNAVVVDDNRLSIDIRRGEHSVATISAQESLLPYIDAYVVDSILYVCFADNVEVNGHCDASVAITTRAISSLECGRLTRVAVRDCFENSFKVKCLTGSQIEIIGVVDTLNIAGHDGANIDGRNLGVNKFANIELYNYSQATLRLDGTVDATLYGGSTLQYLGNPTLRKSDISDDSAFVDANGGAYGADSDPRQGF